MLGGGPGGVISYCDPLGANTVSDTGAHLTSTGGFGTSNATFNVTGVPNNFGLLFAGTAQANAPLGCSSNRCVGGSLVRGPVLLAQGHQVLGATFDMAQFGSTHIQYWFREGGTCTGGNNLSLPPRDLLKIGQLYLDGGRWGTRQVVPRWWVAASLAILARSQGFDQLAVGAQKIDPGAIGALHQALPNE